VKELSGYAFSPLWEGDIALSRGSGNGLAPILLAAADETSLGCVERLEHEYALKGELDANWAARPVALTRYNDRLTLVLEDPGGAPRSIGCLASPWTYRISCASRSLSPGRSAKCMSEVSSIRTSSRQISWWTRKAAASG
jgi:hypothetical protein